jgi:hypothetical protein
MVKPIKKFYAVIIILSFAMLLNSCGSARIPFSPEVGVYNIMLDEEKWSVLPSESTYQLGLFHQVTPNLMLTVNHYPKSELMEYSVPNFDEFVKWCKTLPLIQEVYEGENSAAGELTDADSKDIKGGSVKACKRQAISITLPERESVTEYLYLETDDYYFLMSYNALKDEFTTAQTAINDAVKNLKVITAG